MTFAFLAYVGFIPFIPLIGAYIYKRRDDKTRRYVCYALAVIQLFLSLMYAAHWLKYYV